MYQNYYFVLSETIFLVLAVIVTALIFYRLRKNDLRRYEFITIIVHKFRTPLTQIKWSIGELRSGETDRGKLETLGFLESASDKLVEMTGALVGLSNLSDSSSFAKRLEEFSLPELIKKVADPLQDLFKKKQISFSASFSEKDVMVRADREGIKFIVQTMLENALAYTPSGGSVTLMFESSSGKATVSVSDSGIGITKADLGHIFSRSFRTEGAKAVDAAGFGIGLYLARSVARRHRGDMTVSSEGAGKGSTFKLVLPAA